jgi:hypothetical protein
VLYYLESYNYTNSTKPNQTQTQPNQTKPNQTKPNQTKNKNNGSYKFQKYENL